MHVNIKKDDEKERITYLNSVKTVENGDTVWLWISELCISKIEQKQNMRVQREHVVVKSYIATVTIASIQCWL